MKSKIYSTPDAFQANDDVSADTGIVQIQHHCNHDKSIVFRRGWYAREFQDPQDTGADNPGATNGA